MNSTLSTSKKIGIIIVSVFIAILIILTALIMYVNHSKNNSRYFSSAAAHILNHPVEVGHGEITISFRPTIDLHQVSIRSRQNNILFSANHIQLSINLFQSIIQRKWVKNITIYHHIEDMNTEISAEVNWTDNQNGSQLILSPLTIHNDSACFTGKTDITFHAGKIVSLTLTGRADVDKTKVDDIQLKYHNQPRPVIQATAIAQGGMIENLFKKPVQLSIQSKNSNVILQIANPNIAGKVTYNISGKSPLLIQLSKLSLQFNHHRHATKMVINPVLIPEAIIQIKQLIINNHAIGHFYLKTKQINKGISFSKIKLYSALSTIEASGKWVKQNAQESVQFNGTLRSDHFSQWLNRAHDVKKAQGGKMIVHFALQSQGNLKSIFTLKNAVGRFQFDLRDMTILKNKSQPANVIENMLSLISLQSIANFVTLNFKRLKKYPGFHIFYFRGECRLARGKITTKRIEMSSPVAMAYFSGEVNLVTNQNNLIMNVYPNIIPGYQLGNSPMAIIRFPVWVGKKIISLFIDPFFHLNYRITGTIQKPIAKKIP